MLRPSKQHEGESSQPLTRTTKPDDDITDDATNEITLPGSIAQKNKEGLDQDDDAKLGDKAKVGKPEQKRRPKMAIFLLTLYLLMTQANQSVLRIVINAREMDAIDLIFVRSIITLLLMLGMIKSVGLTMDYDPEKKFWVRTRIAATAIAIIPFTLGNTMTPLTIR